MQKAPQVINLWGLLSRILVGVIGFEPTTPASRRQCSTKLSYTPTHDNLLKNEHFVLLFSLSTGAIIRILYFNASPDSDRALYGLLCQ